MNMVKDLHQIIKLLLIANTYLYFLQDSYIQDISLFYDCRFFVTTIVNHKNLVSLSYIYYILIVLVIGNSCFCALFTIDEKLMQNLVLYGSLNLKKL